MNKVIKVFLWSIALTPFMVSNISFYPFVTGENLFARGILSLVSILFLVNFLYDKNFRNTVTEKINILFKNPLFISILAFIVVFMVSTIFSVNKYNALWGTIERGEGLIGVSYFFSFFIYSLLIFEKKDWFYFFKLNLIIALIFLTKEFIQSLGGMTRPSSFLDNPTFLSGYFLFSIFCAFAVLSQALNEMQNRFWKYLSIVTLVLTILGITLTQTRGTLLGLVTGFICVVIYGIARGREALLWKFNLRKLSAIIFSIVILSSFVFINTRKNEFWQKIPGVGRVALISSEDSTTRTRLLTAQIALNSIDPIKNGVKKFLLGWGPENFSLAYGEYFKPEQFQYEMGWFDRSHNKLLDVLVMNGLLGLIAYLCIYFFFFRYSLKKQIKDKIGDKFSILNVGLIFFGVSMLVHLLFVFDQITTSIPFFAVLSFILYFSLLENLNTKNKQNVGVEKNKKISLGVFLFILSSFTFFVFIRNDLSAYRQMKNYILLKEGGDVKAMLQNVDATFEPFTPAQMNIRDDFLSFVEDSYDKSNEPTVNLSTIAFKRGEEYITKYPLDVRFLVYIAATYSKIGQKSNNIEFLYKGEEYFRKMLFSTPNRPDVNYGLAVNLFFQKKYTESFIAFEKAFDLSPDYFKREGKTVTNMYTVFFKYFYNLKDKDSFIKTARRLKENNYITADVLNRIINSLKQDKWPVINFTSS